MNGNIKTCNFKVKNLRGKPTRHLEEYIFLTDENHPFSNFPLKYQASLGELNPIEIKNYP